MFAKNNITLNFAYISMTTYASDVIYLLLYPKYESLDIYCLIISIIVISTKNYLLSFIFAFYKFQEYLIHKY